MDGGGFVSWDGNPMMPSSSGSVGGGPSLPGKVTGRTGGGTNGGVFGAVMDAFGVPDISGGLLIEK